MKKNKISVLLVFIFLVLLLTGISWAAEEDFKLEEELKVIETLPEVSDTQSQEQPLLEKSVAIPDNTFSDPTKYTLGPDDVIEIEVMRHPEFSGKYPINLEGKIQYKFVGDLEVNGLTKSELEQKLSKTLSNFLVNPEVNVTILEYKSKVIYVLGEVGAPGKYYMRSEVITIRDAVVAAGLPTLAAAMRKCRLITPNENGMGKYKMVDLYSILYGGDLKKNIEMHPGEVLYVPATVMAKVIRVINPVTTVVGVSSSAPSGVSQAKSSISSLAK